jgi:PQQ-like domain
VDGGTAYVRAPDTLTAIDVATGAIRWTASSLPGSSAPAVVSGELVVPTNGSSSCAAVALDRSSGATTAARTIDAPVTGPLWCVASDPLVIGRRLTVPVTALGGFICAIFNGVPVPELISARGFVTLDYGPEPAADAVAVDTANGPCGGGDPGQPPPAQVLGTAVGTASEILWPGTFPADVRSASPAGCATPCDETWSISGIDGDDPASALATSAGDWAVVASSTLTVIGGTSHAVAWTGTLGSVTHLAAAGSTIYAATADGHVAAFPAGGCGAASCAPTWTATVGAASSEISVGADVLYVGGAGGTVSALPAKGCGAATCAPLWSADVAAGVSGRPVIDRGTLLVPSSDGTVTAFRLPA